MEFVIKIKDINKLNLTDVTAILARLSWPDSGSDSSMQKELYKRYVVPEPEPQPEMALALVWVDNVLVSWVGTRRWPEKFKGRDVIAQTVECFTATEYRRRGIAKLGLQALMSAGKLNSSDIVSVYAPEVVNIAKNCGCRIVILREST
jgi:hypothetical protein